MACSPAQEPRREPFLPPTLMDAEEKKFDKERVDARNAVFVALDAAAKNADPAARQRCDVDRKAFAARGTLPASVPDAVRIYENTVIAAAGRLLDAYEKKIERLRRQLLDDEADRHERQLERRRGELEPLFERDLRTQVDPVKAASSGAWSWQGTTLQNDAKAASVLRLLPTGGFPNEYQLRLRIDHRGDEEDCNLVFPYLFAGRRAFGMITLGRGSLEVHALHAEGTEQRKLAPVAGSAVTIVVQTGVVRVLVGDREVATADPGALTPLPEDLTKSLGEANVPYLVTGVGTAVTVSQLRLRSRDARTEAKAVVRPTSVLGAGASLVGRWDSSDAQAGKCRTIEVRARNGNTAEIEVATNGGDVFLFTVEITGQHLVVKDMVHTRPAGRRTFALSEVTGRGWVEGGKFTFRFEVRRRLPKRSDEWTGRIRAELPKPARPPK
ncbi:MAG: hypothetical protein IPK26_03310 [Planctomycetes bacterium]|nr:hypothetical protein [Planctomycetota bacterium]